MTCAADAVAGVTFPSLAAAYGRSMNRIAFSVASIVLGLAATITSITGTASQSAFAAAEGEQGS
jgi:hypothetical protein